MSEIFTNILTTIGQQKKALAEANNTGLNISTFKVGDSNGAYYEPTESQTALKNVKYTGEFIAGTQSQVIVSPSSANEVLYKCFIPADVGGFTIRELGLFDDEGDLILICKLPAQDKFELSSGLYQPLTFTPKIIFTNPQTQAVLTPTSQVVPTINQIINMISEYAPQTEFSMPLINDNGVISLNIDGSLKIESGKLCVVQINSLSTTIMASILAAIMPDYTMGVSKSLSTTYTAESYGWLRYFPWTSNNASTLYIDGVSVGYERLGNADGGGTSLYPIKPGSSYRMESGYNSGSPLIFYPMKGGV